jgi:hypothetical protein
LLKEAVLDESVLNIAMMPSFNLVFAGPTYGRRWCLKAAGYPSRVAEALFWSRNRTNMCPAPCHPRLLA